MVSGYRNLKYPFQAVQNRKRRRVAPRRNQRMQRKRLPVLPLITFFLILRRRRFIPTGTWHTAFDFQRCFQISCAQNVETKIVVRVTRGKRRRRKLTSEMHLCDFIQNSSVTDFVRDSETETRSEELVLNFELINSILFFRTLLQKFFAIQFNVRSRLSLCLAISNQSSVSFLKFRSSSDPNSML